MSCKHYFRRTLLAGVGLVMALYSPAQSQDANPADSTRDNIIQSVRDDVRRKIRSQQAGKNQQTAKAGASRSNKKKQPSTN